MLQQVVRTWRKPAQVPLFTTNPTWSDLGLNPVLRGSTAVRASLKQTLPNQLNTQEAKVISPNYGTWFKWGCWAVSKPHFRRKWEVLTCVLYAVPTAGCAYVLLVRKWWLNPEMAGVLRHRWILSYRWLGFLIIIIVKTQEEASTGRMTMGLTQWPAVYTHTMIWRHRDH
jgi:hypothetical protein